MKKCIFSLLNEEKRNYAVGAYRAIKSDYYKRIFEALGNLTDKRVLDVGCGPGQFLVAASKQKPLVSIGVDIDDDWLDFCKCIFKKRGLEAILIKADAAHLPFVERAFEVIMLRGVLPYLNEELAVRDIARCLTLEGFVFFELNRFGYYLSQIFERKSQYHLYIILNTVYYYFTGRKLTKDFFQIPILVRKLLTQNSITVIHSENLGRYTVFPRTFWLIGKRIAQ